MRLGEEKNILDKVLNENNQIILNHETIYGGQAFSIKNYEEIIDAIGVLYEKSWNDFEFEEVDVIAEKYSSAENPVQITSAEYSQLTTYINNLNTKLPFYYSALESMVDEQDEMAINIKLPGEKIYSLDDLTELNKGLQDVLKLFNIDGEFKFVGFDKGSDWYIIIPVGILSYRFLIACLKIAQEYYKTKNEYFKSKEAERSYQISLKDDEKPSQKGYEFFQEKWLKKFIEDEVQGAMEEIQETNGDTKPALKTKLVKATTKLVKQLGEGTEFHLSLNPPEYAKEESGSLKIDYSSMPKIENQKEESKSLPEPNEEKEDAKEE